MLQPRPDDLVLDICCGPGMMALDFAPHVRHATGCDLTPAMLAEAQAAQAAAGLANLDWIEGDIYRMPFDDGAFSIVFSGAAFHHLEDTRRAFGEMVRVCRPGGRIALRDVTPAAEKSVAYDAMEILRDPSHVHALTENEMRALGDGLPLDEPVAEMSIAKDLPLDAILATSFPEACTIDDLRARFHEDALSGDDRLGFSARLIDGAIHVSYPVTTMMWVKR
jgi:SAM-dependent methyltransferase